MAGTVTFTAEIPESLRRRFKATAAINGTTMTAAVVEAISAWCDEHQNGANPDVTEGLTTTGTRGCYPQ